MRFIQVFVGFLFLLVAVHAQADRWILKNPQTIAPNMKILKRLNLGKTEYVVVESAAYKAQELSASVAQNLMKATRAEAALPDLQIGVEVAPTTGAAPAWHVDRMKYAEIPANLNGAGVTVAVLDTGVSYTHAALMSHVWLNAKEIPGNNVDDDQNGYVDDIRGYNFDNKKNEPLDDASHGTHCAGIIAADAHAGSNARGVAPGVQIMVIKIIGNDSTGFLSNAAEGIKYAVDNGAHILSNSWRVYKSWSGYYNEKGIEMLAEALKYAESKNVIFVAAAGNETVDLTKEARDPMFPGGMVGHKNLFVVSATQSGDGMAYYSNYGSKTVHVAAPGSDIMSTVPGDGWTTMSGTSMATPLVAGVLALGLQKGYTADEAMAKLISTSEANSSWGSKVISGGLINILDYLK